MNRERLPDLYLEEREANLDDMVTMLAIAQYRHVCNRIAIDYQENKTGVIASVKFHNSIFQLVKGW